MVQKQRREKNSQSSVVEEADGSRDQVMQGCIDFSKEHEFNVHALMKET
jgi:hypothetical protein